MKKSSYHFGRDLRSVNNRVGGRANSVKQEEHSLRVKNLHLNKKARWWETGSVNIQVRIKLINLSKLQRENLFS